MSTPTSTSTNSSDFNLGSLVAACRDLVNRTNEMIRTIYEKGKLDVIDKAFDNKKLSQEEELKAKDPTTIADILAQKLIIGSLKHLYSNLIICGEEGDLKVEEKYTCIPNTKFEYNIPKEYENINIQDITIWVDPIDGTKEYTEGIKEAVTTLIGIAYKDRPIAGIIGRPFTGQIIWGIRGLGVYGYDNSTYPLHERNKLRRIICTTRSHFEPHMKAYISACQPSNFVRAGGCGGKILMIIEGIADAYVFPSIGTKRWDTCACEAILLTLGGKLTTPDGKLYNYNANEIKNPNNEQGFIATLFGNEYHNSFLIQNLNIEQLDLILFGATGFTGKIAAEYIIEKYGNSEYKFGLAGRDENKLQLLYKELTQKYSINTKIEIIICNVNNLSDCENLARKSHVIINTVGPYVKYGENIIKSCCKYGVDYIDLTGEFEWVKRMINKYNEEAIRSHSRIINFGGFVSSPMDCGVKYVMDYFKFKYKINPKEDELTITIDTLIKGGQMSGGTTESYFTNLQETKNNLNNMNDCYYLIPDDKSYGPKQLKMNKPNYNSYYQKYVTPSIYGAIDRMIILRSNALLHYEYGQNVQVNYSNFITNSWFIAWMMYVLSLFLSIFIKFKIGRSILLLFRPLLPKSGDGPSRDVMLKSSFDTYIHIQSNQTGKMITGIFHGMGDPGYWNTARMLVEEGLFLVDQRKNPKLKNIPGGFMTPAVAFGKDIIDRWKNNTGTMAFKIEERKS